MEYLYSKNRFEMKNDNFVSKSLYLFCLLVFMTTTVVRFFERQVFYDNILIRLACGTMLLPLMQGIRNYETL